MARLATEQAVETIRRTAAEAALAAQRAKVKSLEVVVGTAGLHLVINGLPKPPGAAAAAAPGAKAKEPKPPPLLFAYADIETMGLTTGAEQPQLELAVRPMMPGQNFCKCIDFLDILSWPEGLWC